MTRPRSASSDSDIDSGAPVVSSVSNDDGRETAEAAMPDVVKELPGNQGEEGTPGLSAAELLVSGTEPFVRVLPVSGGFESVLSAADERVRIFDTTSDPWRKICSLEIHWKNGDVGIGTGWFAGPHTVITAGHCVHDRSSGGWAKQIIVRPARNGSQSMGELTVTRFSTTDLWLSDQLRNQDYDFGAIHLSPAAEEITRKTGWFATAVMSDAALVKQRVNVSGYPATVRTSRPNGTQQFFHAKQIVSVSPLRVFYDIDTTEGQSGSPVWLQTASGPRVIGIHAYGVSTASPRANSGPRLTQPVLSLIEEWLAKG